MWINGVRGLSSAHKKALQLGGGGVELLPRLRGRGATAGCLVQLGVREAFQYFGCGWRGQRYGDPVHAGPSPPRNAAGSRRGPPRQPGGCFGEAELEAEALASRWLRFLRPSLAMALSTFTFFDALGNSFVGNFSVPGVEIRNQCIEINRFGSTSHFSTPKTQRFDLLHFSMLWETPF